MRINKFLAECGVGSRRACDKIIEEGRVKINGKVCSVGAEVNEFKDSVTFDGKKLGKVKKYDYYIMNKPKGCVCTVKDDKGRKTVMDYLPQLSTRVYPVGRLDLLSEGMLLLTDDGELKNKLTHPSHSLPKLYRVKVGGEVSEEQYNILTSELVIDGYKIRPVTVSVGETDESGTVLKMTLTEGRNRQIRKMCEAAGLVVKRLSRISIGNLKLNNLPVGKWRFLEKEEVDYLYKATRK